MNDGETELGSEREPSRGEIVTQVTDLAWPALVELLMATLFGMVDMMMVGHIPDGPVAITAIGLTNQPVFMGLAAFQAFTVGATAVVAWSVGAGRADDADNATFITVVLTSVLGVIVSLIGVLLSEDIYKFMGAEPIVIKEGLGYMQVVMGGIVFEAVSMGIAGILRGVGDSRTPMTVNLYANLLNVFGNYVLIFGKLGFPMLGVTGAGISTTLSRAVAMVIFLYIMVRGEKTIRLDLKEHHTLDRELTKKIITISLPAAGEQLVLRGGQIMYARVVAGLGTTVYAAHQIAINIFGLSFCPGQAYGMAATTLTGQSLGAKKPDMAQKYTYEARRQGMYIAIGMALIFVFLGRQLAMLYTSDPEVISQSAIALIIIAMVQPMQSTQFILSGSLRGAGDTRWPLYSTLIGMWGFRVLFAHIFIRYFGWGIVGAWIATACDQTMRSIVIQWRYRSGLWKHASILGESNTSSSTQE
ncbi:MATE family efflux transporter [Calorimonas adulescens]|uniref:Probable multidrug resistance protein NorM n=1 Tax=Calorimonas adulescens TaxID=2606906 RepID=A0A5D8QCM4_9THEO|nr:MATE family efflux transporter [Calorimonas adulescens]TZE82425.1 MATE family efflux transporter [Calorimonas adulescens]